ncbi:MAG: MBL fold metallo-hydrolase [Propionibacteriales bacterium]|nr:MBL fold metallo-hydrolase [Propionibacteriales bacterium]
MLVAPDIHRIEAPFGPRVNYSYLLVGTDAAMLVDTGTDATARSHLPDYLASVGVRPEAVRYVVNTHSDWDHVAGNGAVRELLPSALFCCHELDRAMTEDIEVMIRDRYSEFEEPHGIGETEETKAAVRDGSRSTPIDLALQGGEWFHLGDGWRVEVVHTPGHSHGSISVVDPRSGSAIIGDAVLGTAVPNADGTPAFPPTYRYVDTYEASIARLRALQPQAVLTSHYPLYEGSAGEEFLAASQAYVERVEAALHDEIARREDGATMQELVDSLGAGLGDWPEEASSALSFPFAGHLERMEREGHVSAESGGGSVRYRAAGGDRPGSAVDTA